MTDLDKELLRHEYGNAFDSISAELFHDDPIGINLGTNLDEYDPEASTILPRLNSCSSARDVQTVVYEEFVRWFDARKAGSIERYTKVASRIWDIWQSRCAQCSDGAS